MRKINKIIWKHYSEEENNTQQLIEHMNLSFSEKLDWLEEAQKIYENLKKNTTLPYPSSSSGRAAR